MAVAQCAGARTVSSSSSRHTLNRLSVHACLQKAAAQQAREAAETLAGRNQAALRRQLDELERAQAQAKQAALAAGHLHRERTEAQLGAVSSHARSLAQR
jgi:hypothetical protein